MSETYWRVLADSRTTLGTDVDALASWFTAQGVDPNKVAMATFEVDPGRRQVRFDTYKADAQGNPMVDEAGAVITERVYWECDPSPLPELRYTQVLEVDDDPS